MDKNKKMNQQTYHLLPSYESNSEIIFLLPLQLWKREELEAVEKISLNRIDQVESVSIVYNDQNNSCETLAYPLFTHNEWTFGLDKYEHVRIHVEMNPQKRNIAPYYISDEYKLDVILKKKLF